MGVILIIMTREEAFLELEQIEKDLETSIFSCMSPFNPMILSSSYEYEKMWEMWMQVQDFLYPGHR